MRTALGACFLALALILILAPLPFGSNRPLPWALLGLSTGALLLLWSLAALFPRYPLASLPGGFWVAAGAIGVVAVVALLQIATFVPTDWHHPLWRYAQAALGEQTEGRISANPFATGTALMRLLTYVGVFWLSFQLCRWPSRAYRLLRIIAAAGLGYAAYGLYVEAMGLKQVAFVQKWAYLDSLSSTFLNRNSYATYAGLGLLCAVALLISGLYLDLGRLIREGLPTRRRFAGVVLRSTWLIPAAACLGLALFLTDSRAGIASSALGIVILLAGLSSARVIPSVHMRGAVGVVAGLGVAAFLIAGQETLERAATIEADLASRLTVYERTLDLIPGVALVGTGYGTFEDVFRVHQGWELAPRLWDHAHNTYLENTLELGLPGAVALIIAIALPAFWCLRALVHRYGDPVFSSIGLAATVLVGVHSLVDFSLEMAAVAVTYAALMGAVCAQTRDPSAKAPVRQQATKLLVGRRLLWPALAAALGAGLLALAIPRAMAGALIVPYLPTLQQVRAGGWPAPGEVDRLLMAARAATRWTDSPELWWDLARAHAAQAGREGVLPRAAESHLRESERALRRSLALAPGNPWGWAQLAALELLKRRPGDVAPWGLRLSLITGPYQPDLLLYRNRLALSFWDALDRAMQAQFAAQFVKAFRDRPAAFVDLARQSGRLDVVRQSFRDLRVDLVQFEGTVRAIAPEEWQQPARRSASIYDLPKRRVEPNQDQSAPWLYPAMPESPAWERTQPP